MTKQRKANPFLAYMAELQQTHYQWIGFNANAECLSFENGGFHYGTLQKTGVMETNLKCCRGGKDRHQDFCV